MSNKYIQRVKDEEYYKNLIEEQKKALKITNKRIIEQKKELEQLYLTNHRVLKTLKYVKKELFLIDYKHLTNKHIEEKIKTIYERIEKLEKM